MTDPLTVEQLLAFSPEEAGRMAAEVAEQAVAGLSPFPRPALDDSWRERVLSDPDLHGLLSNLLASLNRSYERDSHEAAKDQLVDALLDSTDSAVTNDTEMEAASAARRVALVPAVLPFLRACSRQAVEWAETAITTYQSAGGSVELLIDAADDHKDGLHDFLTALANLTEGRA